MHTRAQIVENSTLFRHAEHDALKIPVSSVSLTDTQPYLPLLFIIQVPFDLAWLYL